MDERVDQSPGADKHPWGDPVLIAWMDGPTIRLRFELKGLEDPQQVGRLLAYVMRAIAKALAIEHVLRPGMADQIEAWILAHTTHALTCAEDPLIVRDATPTDSPNPGGTPPERTA